MGIEMGCPTFKMIRVQAEEIAREKKYERVTTNEVSLAEIYEILSTHYDIDICWMQREIELELMLCEPNAYFLEVYKRWIEEGKRVIFTSDMYLPSDVIVKMLSRCGYARYEALFLSNETGLAKTDGSMWQYLACKEYSGSRILHIGDNDNADIEKARRYGIETIHYPAVRTLAEGYREEHIDDTAGSFFRAVVNNALHCGTWKQDLMFEHGFRVGGILAYGFCSYITSRAKQVCADLILFCSRDCDVIYRVYKKYFDDLPSRYIKISRFAMINVTPERNFYELISRVFDKELKKAERSTVRELFIRAGLEYLLQSYSEYGGDPDERLGQKNIVGVKSFLRSKQGEVVAHNASQIEAARKYFSDVVGDHKNILVVDVGWTGSCVTMLDYFLNKYFACSRNVFGALMFGNDNETVASSVMNGKIDAYIASPVKNHDLQRLQKADGPRQYDMNNQMLEYLFTSTDDSLRAYETHGSGIGFVYNERRHGNDQEIVKMQDGILTFAEKFHNAIFPFRQKIYISPYVASGAFYKTLRSKEYCLQIYGNFTYDAALGDVAAASSLCFRDICGPQRVKKLPGRKNILLISHSFSVSGAPRSLLRIGKVLIGAGYNVEVWSPHGGGIAEEYKRENISVRVVDRKELRRRATVRQIKSFDFAVCNTVLTNEYYTQIKKYIPAVWYIREATNMGDYCSAEKEVLQYYDLCHADDILCVSDYAAEALRRYNKDIKVLPNCIEDEADKALPYTPYKDKKLRLVQLGSLEPRKGWDVLLDAYESLTEEEKGRCELCFAGQIVPSAKAYAREILDRAERLSNVHYLGVIKDPSKKAALMSQADVVVVASLDESCSLVALEGAMFSKPLIVTENVGAKYMVDRGQNGIVVKTGDKNSLCDAIKYFLANTARLKEMGEHSRSVYLERANMQRYTADICAMVADGLSDVRRFAQSRKAYRKNYSARAEKRRIKELFSEVSDLQEKRRLAEYVQGIYPVLFGRLRKALKKEERAVKQKHYAALPRTKEIVLSLTSYPARTEKLSLCIRSLLKQYLKADKLVLWLAEEQYPGKERSLPKDLLRLTKRGLTIEWCKEDLKPHKKYFYSMQKYPDSIVITVDDDMEYAPDMTGKLYESYLRHPYAVSCLRAHLIRFNSEGLLKRYKDWGMEDNSLVAVPTFRLLPTGVAGVLYPPHSLPKEAFDMEAIRENALMTDDLWLKVMYTANGYPVVLVEAQGAIHGIEGTQESAISLFNVESGNDINMKKCLSYCDRIFGEGYVTEKLRSDPSSETSL